MLDSSLNAGPVAHCPPACDPLIRSPLPQHGHESAKSPLTILCSTMKCSRCIEAGHAPGSHEKNRRRRAKCPAGGGGGGGDCYAACAAGNPKPEIRNPKKIEPPCPHALVQAEPASNPFRISGFGFKPFRPCAAFASSPTHPIPAGPGLPALERPHSRSAGCYTPCHLRRQRWSPCPTGM